MERDRIILTRPGAGEQSSVQWWILSDGQRAVHLACLIEAGTVGRRACEWSALSVGYHSRQQVSDGQDYGPCDLLCGERCFYDAELSGADDLLRAWFDAGLKPDFIWDVLEIAFCSYFGPVPAGPPAGAGTDVP